MLGGVAALVPQRPVDLARFSPEVRAAAQRLERGSTEFDRASLNLLLGNPNFAALTPQQQLRTLDVAAAADSRGRFELAQLANRQVGDQPALLDRGADGSTTLDSLHRLATGPIDRAFARSGVSRQELLGSTIQEVARPGEINQHSKGTCTVTSISYALAQRNPAEYARLVQGLTTPEGRVTMRNGEMLERNATGIAPDSATNRSASERLLQSSLMEYGNGSFYNYDNQRDRHSVVVGAPLQGALRLGRLAGLYEGRASGGSGLRLEETQRVQSAVFGGQATLAQGADARAALDGLRGAPPNSATLAFPWRTSGHAVTFDRIEGDRVYFRNPWGGQFLPPGEALDDPPRRMENPMTGLESMSLEDARRLIHGVVRG